MPWLKKWLSRAVVFVATVYFCVQFFTHARELASVSLSSVAAVFSGFGVVLVSLNTCIGALVWYLILRYSYRPLPFLGIVGVYFVSQFGKYLPGNVGHHVGRVVLARELGIPFGVAINGMMVEMLWALCVGSLLSYFSIDLIYGSWLGQSLFFESRFYLLAFALILFLMPWFYAALLNFFFPMFANRFFDGEASPAPRLAVAVFSIVLIFVGFTSIGAALFLQAYWVFGSIEITLMAAISVFAVAWIAGFLVPGAPAGLGVRESVMVLLLTPLIGGSAAVGVSLTLRLTTSVSDVLMFTFGVLIRSRLRSGSP